MPDQIKVSADVLNRFKALLKPEQCSDAPEVLNNGASLVAFPNDKEDVQSIVKLAGETQTPLVPVSSGLPHFHSGSMPEKGGIIIDFRMMKQIRKIDSVSRYVWLEPGVTFGELMPELKKQGLKLVTPLLPRANKSVVASRLEREPVIIPKYQYDFIDPLLTLEVIYGTGDEFRTGSASGPGTLDTLKADKVNPWGPGAVDYFRFISGAQGTMGLVTWAITKVEVQATMQKLYFIPHKSITALADIMNEMLRRRVADECLALNNVNLAALLAKSWPGDFEALKKALPPWTLITCLAGYKRRADERIAIMEKYLNEVCRSAKVKPLTSLPGAEGRENDILEILSSPWSGVIYWKHLPRGNCKDIFFLSALSRVGELASVMQKEVISHRFRPENVGAYIQPMVQGRGCHCEFELFYSSANAAESESVKRLFKDASEALLKNGAFFSRPYGDWANMVYHYYPEQIKALKKLKNIFDPQQILNPGKLCF